jgi:hypothetical protein
MLHLPLRLSSPTSTPRLVRNLRLVYLSPVANSMDRGNYSRFLISIMGPHISVLSVRHHTVGPTCYSSRVCFAAEYFEYVFIHGIQFLENLPIDIVAS